MKTTTTTIVRGRLGSTTCAPRVLTIGKSECVVRVTSICPIAEVLGFEDEIAEGDTADSEMIADLLDSRMISPPRPRRRRERALSSRAMFYSAAGR